LNVSGEISCPHCGFRLSNSPELAGQLVQCPSCHGQFMMPGTGQLLPAPPVVLPPIPASGSTESHKLKCPICGLIDCVSKVSTIYYEGTHDSKNVGSSLAVSTPGSRDFPTYLTSSISSSRGVSQTRLSSRLAPPPCPAPPKSRLKLEEILIGFGACLVLFILFVLITHLFSPTHHSIRSDYRGRPDLNTGIERSDWPIILFWLGLGLGLGVLIFLFGLNQLPKSKKEHQTRQNLQRAKIMAWQNAMLKWEQLYYCGRDDLVFDPPRRITMSADQIWTYVYDAR